MWAGGRAVGWLQKFYRDLESAARTSAAVLPMTDVQLIFSGLPKACGRNGIIIIVCVCACLCACVCVAVALGWLTAAGAFGACIDSYLYTRAAGGP
jgi:hypothetical protein